MTTNTLTTSLRWSLHRHRHWFGPLTNLDINLPIDHEEVPLPIWLSPYCLNCFHHRHLHLPKFEKPTHHPLPHVEP